MKVEEIKAKSILNPSQIGDYTINPYIGCQHSCKYCYADYYTKKIYHINLGWGSYVFVKINATSLLLKEITKKRRGVVYLSSLTDPYQPIESKYKLTRKILEILLDYKWPVIIQTKSVLVLRDLDIIEKFNKIEVGFTIITLDEEKRKKFEPFASKVKERIKALKKLKEAGIKTFAFLGPILPDTELSEIEELIRKVDFVDKIYIDKLNYKPGLEKKIPIEWFKNRKFYEKLKKEFSNMKKIVFVY